jgi:citrate lyase gamma subunit
MDFERQTRRSTTTRRTHNTQNRMTDARTATVVPLALPPPDEHILELERLLMMANVGSHELTSGESSPAAGLSAAPSSSRFVDREEEDAVVSSSDAVDANDLARRLNASINESSFMAGDNEEADNEVEQTEGVVVEMEEAPSSEEEASSSEGSGVLVEAPPPDEMRGNYPSDQKKRLVPFQPPQPQGQQEQQLSLFGTTPKFHFYTNETKIPQQLNAIQQQSVRNRQAFQSRIHDVEIKIADLTARLANEEMDRQIDVKNAVGSCVHQPLQAVLEQITCIDQPTTPSLTSRWIAAERNYSALDAKIYHGLHVELAEAKPSQNVDLAGLAVEIREESLVTAKKEGPVARRWETECGILARRYLEERTARIAALQLIGTTLNAVDQRRGQELLETIRELRRKLEVEKDERIASDESALDYIVKRTEAVKRAILEAYTDTDVYEDDFDL